MLYLYLYRYEVKGIQDFVLASSRLKDIAAASELVAAGLDDVRNELLGRLGGRTLISAAGSATLRFERSTDARAFAEVWPLVVHELLPGPQVIAAIAADHEGLSVLAGRLQIDRNQPMAPAYDAGPLVARAARTGRAALSRGHKGVMEDAVLARLSAHRKSVDRRPLERRLLAGTPWSNCTFVGRGDDDWSTHYLAVVHADGNGIGKHVIDLMGESDQEAFKRFSDTLKEVTVNAVRFAIDAVVAQHEDVLCNGVLLMRPVVVGGDDLTILLRPQDAVLFTTTYLSAFEKGTRERGADLGAGQGFTASAGIVFCKRKAPYHAVYHLCEQLVTDVKNDSKREVSALALHRITASPMEPWTDVKRRSLGDGMFCGGPYVVGGAANGLPRVEELYRVAEDLGDLPRGTMREWLRVRQEDGPNPAKLRWDRAVEVARDGAQKEAMQSLNRALEVGMWRFGDRQQRSPLLDAMTLRFAQSFEKSDKQRQGGDR